MKKRKTKSIKITYNHIQPKTPEEKEKQQKVIDEVFDDIFDRIYKKQQVKK